MLDRIFISSDIEGTCGICHWDETELGKAEYEPFRRQMTAEVAACCEGVFAAGDARIDNAKFKQRFGMKAKMLSAEKVEPLIGHGIGGVCPFGVNEGIDVYLDESMKRFETVYPAAGTAASAVHLTLEELERASEALGWVNVTK